MPDQSYYSRRSSFFLLFIMLVMFALPASAQEASTPSNGPIATCTVVSSSASAKEKLSTSIPFIQDSAFSIMVVSVQINGNDPMPFLIDTGLNQPIVIENWAADQLKLVPSKEHITFLHSKHNFPTTTLQALVVKGKGSAQDIEYDSLPASIFDIELPSSGPLRIAGALGLPLFSKFVMQLDFQQHLINLTEHLDRTQLDANAADLPLTQPDPTSVRFHATWTVHSATTITRSTDKAGDKKVITQTKTVTDNLLLDTGSNSSSLSAGVVSFVRPTAMSVAPFFSIEGVNQRNFAFIPKLSIGAFVVSSLLVRSPDVQKDALPADALGMDILEHFRVTLDFPGKQMFLNKFDNKPSASAPTTAGIQLNKRDTGFFVQRILPRSPAEKASIHVGDKVTQVDGVDIASYSVESAQQILDGDASTDAKLLVVSADGNSRQITLPRLTLYNASLYPNYGFLPLKSSSDQTIQVGYILCSSPAWKAGIRAGDVIVAINKTPIKTTVQARALLNPWPRKAMTLTMRRDGKLLSITLKKMPRWKMP